MPTPSLQYFLLAGIAYLLMFGLAFVVSFGSWGVNGDERRLLGQVVCILGAFTVGMGLIALIMWFVWGYSTRFATIGGCFLACLILTWSASNAWRLAKPIPERETPFACPHLSESVQEVTFDNRLLIVGRDQIIVRDGSPLWTLGASRWTVIFVFALMGVRWAINWYRFTDAYFAPSLCVLAGGMIGRVVGSRRRLSFIEVRRGQIYLKGALLCAVKVARVRASHNDKGYSVYLTATDTFRQTLLLSDLGHDEAEEVAGVITAFLMHSEHDTVWPPAPREVTL